MDDKVNNLKKTKEILIEIKSKLTDEKDRLLKIRNEIKNYKGNTVDQNDQNFCPICEQFIKHDDVLEIHIAAHFYKDGNAVEVGE